MKLKLYIWRVDKGVEPYYRGRPWIWEVGPPIDPPCPFGLAGEDALDRGHVASFGEALEVGLAALEVELQRATN